MAKVYLTKKVPLVKRLVLLNGIGRTGKFFLGKIVSGFQNLEYFQYVSILEHLAHLHLLGRIDEDVAISLLQINIDEHAYNMRIGRNLNLRFDDTSSLYNSADLNRYLSRSLTAMDGNFTEQIKNDRRLAVFVLHESLPNIKLFLKAFPDLKWLNLIRHPIDVIYSWYKRGWGNRFSSDSLSFSPLLKGDKGLVPIYAHDWIKEYEQMSEIDRVISSISVLVKNEEGAYLGLSEEEKKNISFIKYEDLVENTHQVLEKIGFFLSVQPIPAMETILAKEKCPRRIPAEEREKKREEIKGMASKDKYNLMLQLATNYEDKLVSPR